MRHLMLDISTQVIITKAKRNENENFFAIAVMPDY